MLSGNDWITEFRNRRIAYGVSQNKLAVSAGITREYLNKIESGKMNPSQEIRKKLTAELERFNPDSPLTMLFDYVRIRFPTTDVSHVVHDILKLNLKYMSHEDYGFYSYAEHYYIPYNYSFLSAEQKFIVHDSFRQLIAQKPGGKDTRLADCHGKFRPLYAGAGKKAGDGTLA